MTGSEMTRGDWVKRVLALALAAALVVALVGGGAALVDRTTDSPASPVDTPEYDPASLEPEPIGATGEIRPDRSETTAGGTVVIDAGHQNGLDRSTIQPMVRALTRVGYDVEFYTRGNLAAQLEGAKAFVVIDPATEYEPGDVETVQRFTGQGGHLLMLGEPSRIRIGGGFFGVGLVSRESALTSLSSAYGMSVGSDYLYNQENADGNYKWITTRPTDASGLDGVNRTTMYTSTQVSARGGTVLLESAPSTVRSSTDDDSGQYPVAVRKTEVVLVGDKTFLSTDKHRVADNEAFATYLVEFVASADREPGTSLPGAGGQGGGGDGGPTIPPEFRPNASANETA